MTPQLLESLGDLAIVFIALVFTPCILFLLRVVWQIKTNDLPHIYRELQRLNGERPTGKIPNGGSQRG